MLKDRADHPHEIHFGRPREPEDLPGGARRDQPRISVDDVDPALRRDRIVQQPFGLAGDQCAYARKVDRGDGGVKLRPFGQHLRTAIETEHERPVHLIDAAAVDGRDLEVEIAAKNIFDIVPSARDRNIRRSQRRAPKPPPPWPQRAEADASRISELSGRPLPRAGIGACGSRARRFIGVEHELSGASRAHLADKRFEFVGKRVESGQFCAIAGRQDYRCGKGCEHDIHDAGMVTANEPRAAPGEFGLYDIAGLMDLRRRRRNQIRRDLEAALRKPAPQRVQAIDKSPLPERGTVHDHGIEHRLERKQLRIDMAAYRAKQELEPVSTRARLEFRSASSSPKRRWPGRDLASRPSNISRAPIRAPSGPTTATPPISRRVAITRREGYVRLLVV